MKSKTAGRVREACGEDRTGRSTQVHGQTVPWGGAAGLLGLFFCLLPPHFVFAAFVLCFQTHSSC